MLQSFLVAINQWISGSLWIASVGSLLWGMVAVALSPCHLASIPLIVAYMGGQDKLLRAREAGVYAVTFTIGVFITIAIIGIVCAMLGRMLGDVGSYWQIIVGLLLIWVALGMVGVERMSFSGSLLQKLHFKGLPGAFMLGLSYGILSGSCTFGFLAPVLAVITIQQRVISGIILILLFGIGHCVPIAMAGSFTASVRKVMENKAWQGAGNWFRKGSGALIGLLGIYFILNPFAG